MRRQSQIYIVGGGIAGLSAAVFAIRDARIKAENIHLFEERRVLGGALDADWRRHKSYSMRGARLINEKAYECYFDMLSAIPCLADQEEMDRHGGELLESQRAWRSIKEEIFAFNQTHHLNTVTRLIGKAGARIDHTKLGLDHVDRIAIIALILMFEQAIDGKRIDEYFRGAFFKTNFWYLFASMFGFEPWHISYAPVAQRCIAQLDAAVLREALGSAPIEGAAEVQVRLEELLLRYVAAVDAPPQAALNA